MSQKKDGVETVLHYLSKRLEEGERKWHPNDLECLAVFWAVKTLRPFLYGRECRVLTDNMVAATFKNQANLVGKYARWAMAINEFEGLTTEHFPGSSNCVADALSRAPPTKIESESSLCAECIRKQKIRPNVEQAETKRMCLLVKRDQIFSPEDISLIQWEDPELRRLIIRLSPPNVPQELSLFQVIKGILYKRNTKPGKQWLLVGPKRLHYDIIRACHADPVGGHEGVAKTTARIQERFWWSGLRGHVARYIQGCTFCQKRTLSVVFIMLPPDADRWPRTTWPCPLSKSRLLPRSQSAGSRRRCIVSCWSEYSFCCSLNSLVMFNLTTLRLWRTLHLYRFLFTTYHCDF